MVCVYACTLGCACQCACDCVISPLHTLVLFTVYTHETMPFCPSELHPVVVWRWNKRQVVDCWLLSCVTSCQKIRTVPLRLKRACSKIHINIFMCQVLSEGFAGFGCLLGFLCVLVNAKVAFNIQVPNPCAWCLLITHTYTLVYKAESTHDSLSSKSPIVDFIEAVYIRVCICIMWLYALTL